MSAAGRIIIAGAGIGGLTAALTLARKGFHITILEAAPRLEEIGAGVQLSPNASGVLLDLGLGPALKPHVVAPDALRVMNARSGREIVTSPLGVPAAVRYGAPFWMIHRADLQRVLAQAALATAAIDLRLGVRLEEFGRRDGRMLVIGRGANAMVQFEGVALIGADGIWSRVRECLGDQTPPRCAGYTAWRALVPAVAVAAAWRQPATVLWLGPRAHVVHYPVRAGAAINIVAIIRETWDQPGWTSPGDPALLQARIRRWSPAIRDLLALAPGWTKWALQDRVPLPHWGVGPVTLLGDAAHPMRPFLAQGAAMAIEDAAVLAHCMAASPDDVPRALRGYEQQRRHRTARVTREALRNGQRYGLRGPFAAARNFVLARMGGERLRRQYDWIYDWKSG